MDRDRSLETLRGLAALSVLLWHTMLGFFPSRSGIFASLPADKALNGSLLYGLINGNAAVGFFFVLSGFVLTRRFFLRGDADFLLRNAIKRWPRLALPVCVVVLLSWAFFFFGWYRFEEAAKFIPSPWLRLFAFSYQVPFHVDFLDALAQGLALTFFRGDSYYDSSLWTMRYEFIGSFIAFGLALLIGPRARILIALYLVAIIVVMIHFTEQLWYAAFPIGVLLAALLPDRTKGLPLWASTLGIVGAVYLAGYSKVDRGVFHPIYSALPSPPPAMYVWILAAAVLLVCVSLNDRIRQILSTRISVFFGWISFPLYLVHIPVLCSLGCATFLLAQQWLPTPYPNVVAALVTMAGSILIAIPFALINDRMLGLMNRWTQSLSTSRRLPRNDAGSG